jgi:putative DNA primase/helicase
MLINNKQLTLSIAGSRTAKNWPASTMWWSEFLERLKTPVRGAETLAEYLALSKAQQDDLKDIGGFVGGALRDGRRKAANVLSRDLVTLDLDNLPAGSTTNIIQRLEGLGCAYVVYSTRKHEEARPRLRIVLPLDRSATADEYEPIARYLAGLMGIECCDPISFQGQSLMYWPSSCKNSQYVYYYADKGFLMADSVLAQYHDWRNVAEWPEVPGVQKQLKSSAVKQGNPLEKSGPVGAFCKTYNIYQAIDKFLPGIYVPVDNMPDRYTYTSGSTTGGAVIYEDGAFLFSHHATDPAGGKLFNSFDLVRLHLFSDQDDAAVPGTPTVKLPSFTAMCQLTVKDQAVAALLNQEQYAKAIAEFEAPVIGDTDWMRQLKRTDQTGKPLKTTENISLIIERDPQLTGKIAWDDFAKRITVFGTLPWNKNESRRNWEDADDSGLNCYLERIYDIYSPTKVVYALDDSAHKQAFNDVQNYLNGIKWDGVNRLDTMLIDYLGAADSEYIRFVSRKAMVGAVARAMTPGVKFDYVPTLYGPQDVGKTSFIQFLGRSWFNNSIISFEGKEASELLQGSWIIELGELSALNKSDLELAKQFITRTEDIYRQAYGHRTAKYPRACMFWGTTNKADFLRDTTGNRRFWPVEVREQQPKKGIFTDLPRELDQLWAEAVVRWRLGEPLYLNPHQVELAREQQEEHKESNAKEGLIREFLGRPVPVDWLNRNQGDRRLYWQAEFGRENGPTLPRDRICAAEIWYECFGGEMRYMKQSDAREINSILEALPGWKPQRMRCGCYGHQRGYICQSGVVDRFLKCQQTN